MAVVLVVVAAPPGGLVVGSRLALSDGRHVVGRARGASIGLGGDRAAHRRHAVLEVDGAAAQIADCGGGSGVIVDGARVGRAALRVGARVRLGATLLERAE